MKESVVSKLLAFLRVTGGGDLDNFIEPFNFAKGNENGVSNKEGPDLNSKKRKWTRLFSPWMEGLSVTISFWEKRSIS